MFAEVTFPTVPAFESDDAQEYPVIADPPLLDAVHVKLSTPADDDVTATFVGADGTVVGVADADVVDGPFPTAFEGTIVNV